MDNMPEQVRNFSRAMDIFIIEIKNLGSEMKNIFNKFIRTLDTAKERFNELENGQY